MFHKSTEYVRFHCPNTSLAVQQGCRLKAKHAEEKRDCRSDKAAVIVPHVLKSVTQNIYSAC